MATIILIPSDDIVTAIAGLNPGDKAILTAGTYDAGGGTIVKDSVNVHGNPNSIVKNVALTGSVNGYKLTGRGEFHTTVCDITSTGLLTIHGKYLSNADILLKGQDTNISVDTLKGSLQTTGYTKLASNYITGNVSHDPIVDDTGFYVDIERFAGEIFEVINHSCTIHASIYTVVNEPPKSTFNLRKCKGTLKVFVANKSNSLNVTDDSNMRFIITPLLLLLKQMLQVNWLLKEVSRENFLY